MAIRFFKVAVIYLVVGVSFGIWMGITQKFQFAPVHAHINLLGWGSLGIMGAIYYLFPNAAKTRLASWHFWLYNIGTAAFVISLASLIGGSEPMRMALIVSSNVVIFSVVLFAINVFANVHEAPRTS
jgi:cbb3-type cytochrome oxidase subunit 1